MNSATLTFALPVRAPVAATPVLSVASLPALQTGAPAWRRYRGVLISGVLHGGVALLAWNLAGTHPAPKAVATVVELIRVAPPKAIVPPPPPPPKPEPQAKPVSLAPPRPVTASVPQPKTVAAPAASAETAPATPAPSAPIGPVTPAAPVAAPAPAPAAKPAPAASKVVSTEGIPTDYVNQVYARINRNTDYPQAAKQRRQQGRVGYVLTLDQQGALLKVEIQPSGVDALDEAAKRAIERAAPFPSLPDLGGSSYLLAGNIVFKLN